MTATRRWTTLAATLCLLAPHARATTYLPCGEMTVSADSCGALRCLAAGWGGFAEAATADALRAKRRQAGLTDLAFAEERQAAGFTRGVRDATHKARADFLAAAARLQDELGQGGAGFDAAQLALEYEANVAAASCLEPQEEQASQIIDLFGTPPEGVSGKLSAGERTLLPLTDQAAAESAAFKPDPWASRAAAWSYSKRSLGLERAIARKLGELRDSTQALIGFACAAPAAGSADVRGKLLDLQGRAVDGLDGGLILVGTPWCRRPEHDCAPLLSPELLVARRILESRREALAEFPGILAQLQIPAELIEAEEAYRRALPLAAEPLANEGRNFVDAVKALLDASARVEAGKVRLDQAVLRACER